jgi:hypothetical protein
MVVRFKFYIVLSLSIFNAHQVKLNLGQLQGNLAAVGMRMPSLFRRKYEFYARVNVNCLQF